MLPFGHHTVTLYHRVRSAGEGGRSKDEWTRAVLRGCAWREAQAEAGANGNATALPDARCTSPPDLAEVCVGDALMLGEAREEYASTAALAEAVAAHEHAFWISRVARRDGQGLLLRHIVAYGSA